MSAVRVVFAAGGTAGHIEPALTVADALRAQDPETEIVFLGGERGLESTLVPQRGYELRTVPAVPFPRSFSPSALSFPHRMWQAIRQATEIVRGSDVVVGFGGYPAVPGYVAARRRKIPLVIHEANAKAGLANRLGSRWTPHVYATYPEALSGAQQRGLPLRPQIAHLDRVAERASAQRVLGVDGPTLLVFGGSQGAQHLNTVLAEALPALLARGFNVIHAYGSRNPAPTTSASAYRPYPYLDNMAQAYAAADLVLCRAGAMTCAEVVAAGLPAVFVPLPIGNGEQRMNAAPIVAAGGAIMIDDADLTAAWLVDSVSGILGDPARREGMERAMRSLAAATSAANSAEEFASDIRALVEDGGEQRG